MTMVLEDHLLTESRNPHSESIDTLSPREIVRLMNAEDARVVEAVGAEAELDRAGDRMGGGPVPPRRPADLRRRGDIRPPGGPRRRRVPAHLQHAPRDGGRADRGRSRPR